MGLEPTRRCRHQILSLARLPIPALPRVLIILALFFYYFKCLFCQKIKNKGLSDTLRKTSLFFEGYLISSSNPVPVIHENDLCQLSLCQFGKFGKAFRVVHSHIREDLAVEIHICEFKAVNKLGV